MFETHSGERDVKKYRLLSASNTFASQRNESVSGLESDFTYGFCDIAKITRTTSLSYHMKSIISSGTKPQRLPGSVDLVTCSDIYSDYKSMVNESSHDDTDNKSEQTLTMPVLVMAINRRAALGDIFQDTGIADFDHILSIYESRTCCDELRDMPEEETPQSRRMALADIFQGVSTDELAHILSTDDDQENDSMLEVLDMVSNINEEQLQNSVRRSSQVHNCRRSSDVYENTETPLRCRRCALADIFDDIDMEDVQTLLSTYGEENMKEDFEGKLSMCRRFALADIFCDINDDDIWRLVELSCDNSDDEEQQQEPGNSRSCDRRLALADIFCDVSEEDILKVLSDDYEEHENVEDREDPVINGTTIRRAALGNIFSDVASNDMLDFMSKYGTARIRN